MKFALSFVALGVSVTAAGLAGAQPPDPTSPMSSPTAPTTQATPATPATPTTTETTSTTTTTAYSATDSTYPTSFPAAEAPPSKALAAPRNAFELSLGTGYTQGFGNLKSGVGMPSVVTPGVAFDLGLGYRIDPNLAVLWTGEYAELTAERVSTARTFNGAIAVQYHIAPMKRVDPWVEAGVGYRALMEDPNVGPNLWTHGFQLARVRAGVDFRTDENVAIGPMIGADATVFLFQDIPNVQTNIANPTASTFIFAGLQGRFDFGETTRSKGSAVSAAAR